MATFRKVHTSFWSDSFISELSSDKKLFYLYLITNEKTKQCGIYEITKKQMAFDLGYSIDTVSILLQYFIDTKKIRYNEATNELALKNWTKFNDSTSPKVKACINKDLELVKDRVLIQYIYCMDTQSQEEEEEEEEKEKIQEEDEDEDTKTPPPSKEFLEKSELPINLPSKESSFVSSVKMLPIQKLYEYLRTDDEVPWMENICINHKIGKSKDDLNLIAAYEYLKAFYNHIKAKGETEKTLIDFKDHFNNWLRLKRAEESKIKVDPSRRILS